MLKSLFIFFLMVSIIEMQRAEHCDRLGVLLYEEIGCKPVKDHPGDLCPARFDCQHFNQPCDQCLFQGKKYNDGETLPDDPLIGSCRAACFCSIAPLGYFFTCAVYDCPEFLERTELINKDCFNTYKLDSCCSTGQICPPFDNIATCIVDDVVYREGQRFSPKNTCSNCVCQKRFDGKYEAPFCERKFCAVEIDHSDYIRNKCAPVYHKGSIRCCPHLWVCPSESDVLTPAQNEGADGKICVFGEKEIKNGQVIHTNLETRGQKFRIKCDCQLPPLLTCIIKHSEYTKIEATSVS